MKTKFGIHLGLDPSYSAKDLAIISSYIENLGFDGIFFADSFFLTFEPLAVLASISTSTNKLDLGTCVYLLALRNPLHVAKLTSSIQLLSNGRLIFGIGAGWRDWEFNALGIPFEKRGKILDEAIDILKLSWNKEVFSYKGEFFDFKDVAINLPRERFKEPKIWVGGNSEAAMKRAVRKGDGWIPTDFTLEEYRRFLPKIKEELSLIGKENFTIASHLLLIIDENKDKAIEKAEEIARQIGEKKEELIAYSLVGDPSSIAEKINKYNKLGVSYHVLSTFYEPSATLKEALKIFSEEVIPSI